MTVYMYVWASVCCYRLISPPLRLARGYLTAASCCRDQVWKQILRLQPAVPAAAGGVLSHLLNLPHFNQASALLLSSCRSLARIPKCPASSPQSPLRTENLCGVSTERERRGPERRVKRKEEKADQSLSFLNITTNRRDALPGAAALHPAELQTRASHVFWYCKTNRVLFSQIELDVESIT